MAALCKIHLRWHMIYVKCRAIELWHCRALIVPCAQLSMDAPLRWLRLGWQDFSRAKALSLLFGSAIAVISVVISLFAYSLGRFALLAALLSGFVFIAPLIAVGLYWEPPKTPFSS